MNPTSAFVVLASLAAAAGCIPLSARSSASVLGPERSSVLVTRAPAEAADDLVRLFTDRGHPLIDHAQKGTVIALRFAGSRRMLVEKHHAREVGSVYYAFIAPHAPGATEITIVGRPTYDGTELCTDDLRLEGPCSTRYGDLDHDRELDGSAEARLVHGVFSELRMRGVVDDSAAPAHRRLLARDICRAMREKQLARALEHRDIRARAAAYRSVPSCE